MNVLALSRALNTMIPLLVRFDVHPQSVSLTELGKVMPNGKFEFQSNRWAFGTNVSLEFDHTGELTGVKLDRVRSNGGHVTDRWPSVGPGKGPALEAWLDANGYTLPPDPPVVTPPTWHERLDAD